MGDYGTSDIEWRRLDPKTWELSNKPPAEEPPTYEQYQQEIQPNAIRMFDEAQQRSPTYAPAELSQEQQRRQWRQQFRNFDKTLKKEKDPDKLFDAQIQGTQELLDSGAMWIDEKGDVYGALERHPGGKKGTQRILDAARTWGDWFRDQVDYGEDMSDRTGAQQMFEQMMAEKAAQQFETVQKGIR